MVTVAKTKMIVMPARSTLRAISLGVFWRTAPSTSAIIRSRKVEPGAAVMRTLTQSDSTRVPPVTAERSPPLSRMTGADSPVMADSSTEATPSITSPSLGIMSPASTSTRSPSLRSRAETISNCRAAEAVPVRRLAWVWVRVRRRFSAWALPRPSATASEKLAKITVNQSQNTIWAVKPIPPWPARMSRIRMTVVSAETISTTNITGLRASVRGLSLRRDSQAALIRISEVIPATTRLRGVSAATAAGLVV